MRRVVESIATVLVCAASCYAATGATISASAPSGTSEAKSRLLPGCAASISAAIGTAKNADVANGTEDARSGGYRVVRSHWDPLLNIDWVEVEDCAHPERPWRTVAVHDAGALADVVTGGGVGKGPSNVTSGTVSVGQQRTFSASRLNQQPVLVRVGQNVMLWSNADKVRINLQAVAEQSGRAGDTIWLHLNVMSASGGTGGWQRCKGIVRDAGSVEMVQ